MDRWRAAGALLALAACIACSAAAPTASNHTALDLYDGAPDGCYYNFQHYGEGDRIMTNEPCLNCTCHNRMLMCYLRVCPFTKPIGQDCTVEKRADQCCPIVTCPDVPVDLLTSTSTSSPAEYGSTGIGKLDKYGCSINGKYFSEGSKVPSTPNKPCEHCYCIRNMTTCVMQECTLHVDGCTPIYHKDVCCPVRYSCDHQDDEILLLDDMTTTVRPTPGFLLTTTTVSAVTQMTQDCVYNGKSYPDGGHIKTENVCDHCYCMKGDIVCVVQECGSPMENEGKNCSSLPPREGHCCPDTYICEGDELSTEVSSEITTESLQEKLSSLSPPRRTGVEGSGYRNEPDESPYTDAPILEPEVEGSGEEQASTPSQSSSEIYNPEQKPGLTDEILDTTEDVNEYISLSTKKPVIQDIGTTVAYADNVQSEISGEVITDETSEPHEFIPYTTIVPNLDKNNIVTLEPSEEEIISDIVTEKDNSRPPQFEPSTSVLPNSEEDESITLKPIGQDLVTIRNAEEKTSEIYETTTRASILDVENEMETVEPLEPGPITEESPKEGTSDHHEKNLSTTSSHSTQQGEIFTTEQAIHEVVTKEIEKETVTIDPLAQNIVTSGISTDGSSEPHLYEQSTPAHLPVLGEEKDVVETESEEPYQYIPTATSTSKLEEDEQAITELNYDQVAISEFTDGSHEPQQHILSTTMSTYDEQEKPSTLPDKEREIISDDTTEKESTDAHIPSATNAPERKDNIRETTEASKDQDIASDVTISEDSSDSYKYTPSTTSSPNLDDIEKETTVTSQVKDFTVENDVHEISESNQYFPSTPAVSELDVRVTTESHKEQDFIPTVTIKEDTSTSDINLTTTAPASEETTEIISESIPEEESPEGHDYTTSTLRVPSSEDKEATTEPDKGLNTIPSGVFEEESSDSSLIDKDDESTATQATDLDDDKSTQKIQSVTTVESELPSSSSESYASKDDQHSITTEPTSRKEDDSIIQPVTHKGSELTTATVSLIEEVISTSPQTDTEAISPLIEQETKATSIPLPEYTHETKETLTFKEPTTESFSETSTSSKSTDTDLDSSPIIEKEAVSTTPDLEKLDLPELTTINPGENEIKEDSILTPGRIPGEGDCLLNSVTYRNDSSVPNTNKCHTDCKCISSIIKCNPIICSPPPDYMDNCQPTYDSSESCCPTYVCDHSRETIPPQPHSQMSGTETPVPSPTIECQGDECGISEDKKQPTELSEGCSTGNCLAESSGKPEALPESTPEHQHKECTDGKCTPVESCGEGECQPPANQDLLCDQENGCQVSPVKPCEGESCHVASEVGLSQKPEACNYDEGCKDSEVSETPSIQSQEETKRPQEKIEQECTEESCRRKGTSDVEGKLPGQCTGSDCVQRLPDLSEPALDSQISTELTPQDHTSQEKIKQEEVITTLSTLHIKESASTTAPEEFMTEKLETTSEASEYANTDTNKLIPELTETQEEHEIATKEPEIASELTETPKLHETATKEQETVAEQTTSGSLESETSSVLPEIIEMETHPEKERTTIGESITEYQEATSTKSPELLVTESLEQQPEIPKIPVEENQESETRRPTGDEIYTESPINYVTKTQDDTTKNDHIEIETELSDITKEEHTEGPQITEEHVIYTAEPELPVTENYDVFSSSPQHEETYTEAQQETKSPDVMKEEPEENDKSTESPKPSDIERDQETWRPDSTISEDIKTKSPITETSQEFVTESYIPDRMSTLTQEDIKIESTESTEPDLKPEVTPSAIESEESGLGITKSPIDEEVNTELSLPAVSISDNQISETPIKEDEQKTDLTPVDVATSEVPVTNIDEEIIQYEITTVREMSVTQEIAESTTKKEIFDLEKDSDIPLLPDSHVTELIDISSETTVPTILGQAETSTEYQPESPVTGLHDLSQPQKTGSKLPASFTTISDENVSAIDETHIKTESSDSEVTEPQNMNEQEPTTARNIVEKDETKTILPDTSATELPIKVEAPYDFEDQKDTTELPALNVPEKIVTETPDEHVSDQDINTENPELVAPEKEEHTEMPSTHIIESEKESPDTEDTGLDEETESPIFLKEETKTENPEKSTERQPFIEVESDTDKPAPNSEEKEVTTPAMNTEDPHIIVQDDVTSTENHEVSTEVPTSIETESSEPYTPVHQETSSAMPTVDDVTVTGHPETVSEEFSHTISYNNELSTKPSEEEKEGYTHTPAHISTESQDTVSIATTHPVTDGEHATKVPVPSTNYESEKELDEVTTSVTTVIETFTKSPDEPATNEEEILVSLVTESHRTSTNVPIVEIPDDDQKTTENVETNIVTKEPEIYETEEQVTFTNTPDIHKTTSTEGNLESSVTQQNEIDISESISTGSPETSTILGEPIVTELPESSVNKQESETNAPITESAETYEIDHTIEEVQKLMTDMPPNTEETHKEIPASTESQFIQPLEPSSTEPQEIDIQEEQDIHGTEQTKIQTEAPLSMVTELAEANTDASEDVDTVKLDTVTKVPEIIGEQEPSKETDTVPQDIVTEMPVYTESSTKLSYISTDKPEPETTISSESEQTLTPYPVKLDEHSHKDKEDAATDVPSDKEHTTISLELPETPVDTTEKHKDYVLETVTEVQGIHTQSTEDISTPTKEAEVSESDMYQTPLPDSKEVSEITTQSSILVKEPSSALPDFEDNKHTIPDQNKDTSTFVPTKQFENEQPVSTIVPDEDKLTIPDEGIKVHTEKVSPATEKPAAVESSAPEEEFILVTTKGYTDTETTSKFDEEVSTLSPSDDKYKKPEEKPNVPVPVTDVPEPPKSGSNDRQPIVEAPTPDEELIQSTTKGTTSKFEEEVSTQSSLVDKYTKPAEKPNESAAPELPKPVSGEIQPTDEVPTPEEEGHFPPSEVSGYGPEPDYVEEDQAFGPGTCRYGGKVYVSAQQIPRDDPCDFCFCFRSDIICLQQSCPPPIHGCHEEPIQGFCCPRYECPVSMATTLNVTTTTTTTTTTLPPHFPTHSYKGAAQRRGCQIKGHTYKVGEVVRASSGPCLHCTCGGDGQMKCDPKACTPEPMLRQMIAAAVSAKRRR